MQQEKPGPAIPPSPAQNSEAQPAGFFSKHRRWFLLLAIIATLFVFGELWRRISQASDLRSLEARIGGQVTQLAAESNAMASKIANAQSDEEVARWAREDAKMVQPGEVLVMPKTPVAAVEPTAMPNTPPEAPPNWKYWWEWFWGE